MKQIVWLVFMASFHTLLFAKSHFVLYNPNGLIVDKSQDFVEKLSSELKQKTGFSLYVVAVDAIGETSKEERSLWKKSFLDSLTSPYGVIFFFKESRKIDIVMNPDLGIDRGEIISRFMVPILTQDKEMNPSKISAAILNGYAQLADEIASHFGVVLEENLIVDRSGVQDYVHYLVYVMLGIMFGLLGLIYVTRNKR